MQTRTELVCSSEERGFTSTLPTELWRIGSFTDLYLRLAAEAKVDLVYPAVFLHFSPFF